MGAALSVFPSKIRADRASPAPHLSLRLLSYKTLLTPLELTGPQQSLPLMNPAPTSDHSLCSQNTFCRLHDTSAGSPNVWSLLCVSLPLYIPNTRASSHATPMGLHRWQISVLLPRKRHNPIVLHMGAGTGCLPPAENFSGPHRCPGPGPLSKPALLRYFSSGPPTSSTIKDPRGFCLWGFDLSIFTML